MIDTFNEKKDVLVIPKTLNINTLAHPVKSKILEWDKLGRVIRLSYIYSPAVIKSYGS